MKAVIPAAGLGTRFLPATKVIPKEMVPVLDRPAIQYVVEEAINSGIEDILIITSRWKHAIEDHFDLSMELERYLEDKGKVDVLKEVRRIGNMAMIHYIRQKVPMGLGDAIYHAKDFVNDEYFAVLLPDDIIVSEVPCIKQLMSIHEKWGAPVLSLERIPDERISRYGVAEVERLDERLYKVKSVVEKPPFCEAPSNMAVMGRYILPPEIFGAIERTAPGHGREIQITDAIGSLLKDMEFMGLEFVGKRYDVGSINGWLRANIELALSDERYRKTVLRAVDEG